MAVTFPLYYSYATAAKPVPAPQCGFWDLPCKLGQAGKFITDSALGQANAEQQNFNQKVGKPVTNAVLGEGNAIQGVGNDIQSRFKKGVDRTNADLKHVQDSVLGESNAIQQTLTKGFSNAFPWQWILLGGGALLAIVLIVKR